MRGNIMVTVQERASRTYEGSSSSRWRRFAAKSGTAIINAAATTEIKNTIEPRSMTPVANRHNPDGPTRRLAAANR